MITRIRRQCITVIIIEPIYLGITAEVIPTTVVAWVELR